MNRLILLLFGAVTFVAHAQVPDYVPTEGLVAWYPFNGNANDESGNDQHGSMTDIQIVEDRFGIPSAAFEFNGSSSFVQIESTPMLSVSSAYTLSAWFNNYNWSFDAPIDEHAIVSKIVNGAYYGGYEIYTGGEYGAGMLRHIGNINGNFGPWTAGLSEFTWYHVIASFNGNSIAVYINGESVATQSRNGSLQTSSTPLRIGRRGGAGTFNCWFQGVIDDIGIWNRALTEEEILALYNAPAPTPGCTDSLACNFNEAANDDDSTCTYPPFGLTDCEAGGALCGEGTIWDASLQTCVGFDDCPADLNGNGLVEVSDLLMVLADFGTECPPEVAEWTCGDPVSYHGYDYATVQIGEQCWFAENLRTEQYRNGDSIPMIYGTSAWLTTVEGALCWHNNDSTSWGFPGFLYNGYSVADERGVCPNNWHVSTDTDWIAVEISHGLSESEAQEYGQRGGAINLSQKMRDESWGQNELGFAVRRGGYRNWENGSFSGSTLQSGAFWSNNNSSLGYRELYSGWSGVARGEIGISEGLSIRCIKD